jgi:hypothetical protein
MENTNEGWLDPGLSFDRDYDIYGIGLYNDVLKILIDPEENCRPNWYSLSEFDITEPTTCSGWKMCVEGDAEWSMIMGYDRLVSSAAHFDGILERDSKELELFNREKLPTADNLF